MSNVLTIPPIHVEHVAEAVVLALNAKATEVRGVLGVREMRELLGWFGNSSAPRETTPAPTQL
jgi:hypothetical protein